QIHHSATAFADRLQEFVAPDHRTGALKSPGRLPCPGAGCSRLVTRLIGGGQQFPDALPQLLVTATGPLHVRASLLDPPLQPLTQDSLFQVVLGFHAPVSAVLKLSPRT